MKKYKTSVMLNLRDLGGYRTVDEKCTQFGKILRSDCPCNLDEKDKLLLNSLNIDTVIDLRTKERFIQQPSYFMSVKNTKVYNVNFANGNRMPEKEKQIAYNYKLMLEEKDTINSALRAISNTRGSVLIHCAVGKDRTGILSAIILLICGVSLDKVLDDYAVSGDYLKPLMDEIKRNNPTIPKWIGQSKREYLKEAFNLIIEEYQSIDKYFEALGISNEVIANIKQKLIG